MQRSNRHFDSAWKLYREEPGVLEYRASGSCLGCIVGVMALLVSGPWTVLTGTYHLGPGTVFGVVLLAYALYWMFARTAAVLDRNRGVLELSEANPLGIKRETLSLAALQEVHYGTQSNGRSAMPTRLPPRAPA